MPVATACLRCADLPPRLRCQREFCQPLIIIPGPTEPKNIDVYFKMTLDALQRIGPVMLDETGRRQGGQLTVVERGPDGSIARGPFVHCVFLGAVHADTPAQRKMSQWAGHSARCGCGRCLLLGTSGNADNDHSGMRFLGYNEEAQVNQFVSDDAPATAHCGDAAIKISHEQHVARATFMEAFHNKLPKPSQAAITEQVQNTGCHGMPALVARLSYANFAMMWAPPLYHAALYGVVKRFWNLVLCNFSRNNTPAYAISRAARLVMSQRAEHLVMTNDMNRPYADIVNRRGNWVMEDWMRWTCEYSRYILMDIDGQEIMPTVMCSIAGGPPQPLRLAWIWEKLRDALIYHFRFPARPSGEDRDMAATAASNGLFAFAMGAESVFGADFCTYNLHMLVCALQDAEKALGHLSYYTEMWVERGIQEMKSGVKFRTVGRPEMLYVSEVMARNRLQLLHASEPLIYRDFDSWVPEYRSAEREMPNGDDGAQRDGTQLLGPGTILTTHKFPAEYTAVLDSIVRMLRDEGGDDDPRSMYIMPAVRDHIHMVRYRYAQRAGEEVLLSTDYRRARTRESYYAKVRYGPSNASECDNNVQVFIAEINYFALLQPPSGYHGDTLRIAVCNLYKCEVLYENYMYRVANLGAPSHRDWAVEVHSMSCKVLHVRPRTGANYFLQYITLSQS